MDSPEKSPQRTDGQPSLAAKTAARPVSDLSAASVDVHVRLWDSPDQLGHEWGQGVRDVFSEPWERPDTSPHAYDQAVQAVQHAVLLGFESRHLGASVPAEQVARHVQRNPFKYLGFAGIDPLAPGYLSAVRGAVGLGLVGVTICPAAGAFHPCHSRAMWLYELCQEMKLPVVVQSGCPWTGSMKMEYSQPCLFDEVAGTFPDLRFVLGGCGGSPWVGQALAMVGKHAHAYADVADLCRRPWQLYQVLLQAHQEGAISRLLFGSGYPFCTSHQAIHNIYSVNTRVQGTQMPTIPREQLRGIVERDVFACLGLKRPGSAPATDAAAPGREKKSRRSGLLAFISPRPAKEKTA